MTKKEGLHPHVFYHIYNRGNNRENIFIEERNYRYFLQRYAQYIEPVATTYAYCLLKNHFHLLVRIRSVEEQEARWREQASGVLETPEVVDTLGVFEPLDASRQFSKLFNGYAKAINKAYGRTGSLFEGRFKRLPVKSQAHLIQLVIYIHRNPEKHGFVKDFRKWPYSSYGALTSERSTRVGREAVLEWVQGQAALVDAHTGDDSTGIEHLVPDDFF